MGYYIEWGDYKNITGTIIDRLNISMLKKGLRVIETIHDRKIREHLRENHNELKIWGTENLEGMWTLAHVGAGSDRYVVVFFELEVDCVGFKLTWM